MNNYEWQQIGADIKKQVQDAIDANDFSRLSKTIGDTVSQAIDGGGSYSADRCICPDDCARGTDQCIHPAER